MTDQPIPQYHNGQCIGQLMPTTRPEVLAASPGIQDWSTHAPLPLAIVSAYVDGLPEYSNGMAHSRLLHRIKRAGIECGEVNGSYYDSEECAVLCELRSGDDWQYILEEAAECRQESVLFINCERIASLFYVDSCKVEKLGKLRPVSYLLARQLHSWTQTKNGQFYAVF